MLCQRMRNLLKNIVIPSDVPGRVFMKSVDVYEQVTPDFFQKEIFPRHRPALLKGFFDHWPLVKAAKNSTQSLMDVLKQFGTNKPVRAVLTAVADGGQLQYREDFKGFNFRQISVPFNTLLDEIHRRSKTTPSEFLYMASTIVDDCAPSLMHENLNTLIPQNIKPRLWIGNKSVIQPHFDVSDNIAVVTAGKRRFTFFPPEQIDNLYIGPIDITPAGQPISLVSLKNPDLEKYPRYQDALATAEIAELEPGDAVFIPSLWWHGVEGLDDFNFLVNYWWGNSSLGNEDPYNALIHGILTISTLPEKERLAWQHFFNHYVFQSNGNPLAHMPEAARGVLGEMNPALYQAIRQYLYSRMKR